MKRLFADQASAHDLNVVVRTTQRIEHLLIRGVITPAQARPECRASLPVLRGRAQLATVARHHAALKPLANSAPLRTSAPQPQLLLTPKTLTRQHHELLNSQTKSLLKYQSATTQFP